MMMKKMTKATIASGRPYTPHTQTATAMRTLTTAILAAASGSPKYLWVHTRCRVRSQGNWALDAAGERVESYQLDRRGVARASSRLRQ